MRSLCKYKGKNIFNDMLSAEGEGKNVTLKATGVNLTPLAVFLGKLYNMGAVSDKIYIYIDKLKLTSL